MKKLLEIILALYAKLALSLHKPKIIGITGSVGKSSTKDAVALVLGKKFHVGASSGNLNSQLGLPMAILGFSKPGGFKRNLVSYLEWLWIAVSGFFRIFRFNFPKILVLEMGSDKPGDIAYLLGIVGNLDIAIITDIGISHMEFFPSTDALASEKLSLLNGLDSNGIAILNADNPKVLAGKNKVSKVITYGFNSGDVVAQNFQNNRNGLSFSIHYNNQEKFVAIPNALGKPVVYASLAAAGCGIAMKMSLEEITHALERYHQPAGRLHIIPGINNSIIIDDTYNAAPSSTIAAIDALLSIQSQRKLAAIGHMAELGNESEAGHREIGAKIAQSNLDVVFLVGEKTKATEDELRKKNFAGKVFWFSDSDKAKEVVKQNIMADDTILVKGSQSARTEKIVREIMANPTTAKQLLVRQSKQWLKT